MPRSVTIRRWRRRLTWPAVLAAIWFVLYTSARVFDTAYVYPDRNVLEYLFSMEHLSQPLGWLFLLSLLLVFSGLLLHAYVVLTGQ